jgi:hypothetical protein
LNLKVLFIVFLCLFSASIICNTAAASLDTVQEWSCEAFTCTAHAGHVTINRTEPAAGDPIGGGWP